MSAMVDVRRGGPATEADLEQALAQAVVTHGIDPTARAAIVEALGRPLAELRHVVVARGTDPVAGRAATFEPAFDPALLPGRELADGSFDFHQRGLLKLVEAGDRLGLWSPAGSGIAGRTVTGRDVPAVAGKAAGFTFGPGVEVLADGAVRAKRAGAVAYRPGSSLDVSGAYTHAGSVDLQSGDLVIDGSITVQGDVAPTLRVAASGDVVIRGSVDGGAVRAGGSAHVGESVRGPSAFVSAEGDVVARRAELSTLRSGATLRVGDAVGADLAGRRVEVTHLLRGGRATGEEAVVVREAGAADGTRTLLVAGEPARGTEDSVVVAVGRAKAARAIGRARGALDDFEGRSQAKRGKGGRGQAALATRALSDVVALAGRREALARKAFVFVTGSALPGVRVQIGPFQFELEEPMHGVRFSLDPEHGHLTWEGSHR
jgi:hypothetical protein